MKGLKMKRLSILLLVLMVSLSSYAINEKKETAKESGSTSFQPKPLDDKWSKWLVGEWKVVSGESSFTYNHKYTLPNGRKMEDNVEFARKKD